MPTGYGNDKDNEGNSHNEDVDSTDFKANWKIYFFFQVGAEGPERWLRAEDWVSRKTKTLVKPIQ